MRRGNNKGNGPSRGLGVARGMGYGREGSSNAPFRDTPQYNNNNLRDIDLELDMLKRQRLILQQKQALLDRESEFAAQRQSNFNESSSYSQRESNPLQFNSSYNYSQLYDGSINKQQGVKRQAVNVWQDPPPKRSNPRLNPWASSANKVLTPFDVHGPSTKPLMNIKFDQPKGSFRPRSRPDVRSRRDFKPNKVTKPNTQATQLPSQWSDKKRALISNSIKSAPDLSNNTPDAPILKAGRLPTPRMKGRMELALGNIIKDLRLKYSSDPAVLATLQNVSGERLLKKMVRERISEALVNKPVGNLNSIQSHYRAKFPEHTDSNFIKTIVKDAAIKVSVNKPAIAKIAKKDTEIEAYKQTIFKMLDEKIADMFKKLESIYEDRDREILEIINELPDLNVSKELDKSEVINVDENGPKTNPENAEDAITKKIQDYTLIADFMLQKRLPKILPRFKNTLFRLLYGRVSEELLKKDNVDLTQSDEEKNDVEIINEIPEKSNVDEPVLVSDDNPEENQEKDAILTDVSQSKADEELNETNTSLDNSANTSITSQKSNAKISPYYVKLFGRPNLPSKPVIYKFLTPYNPATIKKHKSVNNLLVIGFTTKEDLEKIIEKNECVLEGATLFIKASEQITENTPKSTPQKIQVVQDEQGNLPEQDSNMADTSHLNENINNLLCSTQKESGHDVVVKASIEEVSVSKEHDESSSKSQTGVLRNEVVDNVNDATSNLYTIQENSNNESNIVNVKSDTIDITNDTTSNLYTIQEDVKDPTVDLEARSQSEEIIDVNAKSVPKESVPTPTRASSRIKTRRTSKLIDN